jgi:hypothetical protein
MKQILITLFSVLIILPLQAQDESSSLKSGSPMVIGRLSLISPKLIAEIAPSDQFTLTTGFWMRASFWTTNSAGNPVYRPLVSPSFTVEPRYYFNLEDRRAKGKRTDYFSGWYLGVPFNIEFPDLRYSIGGTIGFQCTMGKRWYWNISTGPGLTFADSRFHLDGVGDFGLGLILNKM